MGNKAIASVKKGGKSLPRSWEPKPSYGPRNTKRRAIGVVLNKR